MHVADTTTNASVFISTWNVWGIPVVSPQTLSRCQRVAGFLETHMCAQKFVDSNQLVVACFQEAWNWRTGLASFLLRGVAPIDKLGGFLARGLSQSVQVVCIFLGLLLPRVLRLQWDDYKHHLVTTSKKIGLPYAYGVDGVTTSSCTFLDSGLLITSNVKASSYGFTAYKSRDNIDAFANKGMMWAHFKQLDTVVINTHLQCPAGTAKRNQVTELATFITTWKTRGVKNIIVTGDFNFSATAPFHPVTNPDLEKLLKLHKLSTNQNTTLSNNCVDHVFYNNFLPEEYIDSGVINAVHPPQRVSDHNLCYAAFPLR